jgi:hypothetical protein
MSRTTQDASRPTATSRATRVTKYQPGLIPVYPVEPGDWYMYVK